jgi:hypothetical protein
MGLAVDTEISGSGPPEKNEPEDAHEIPYSVAEMYSQESKRQEKKQRGIFSLDRQFDRKNNFKNTVQGERQKIEFEKRVL